LRILSLMVVCAASGSGMLLAADAAGSDRRIDLAVVVTDKSGKPVAGLKQEDFTLLDNGKPKPLAAFEAIEEQTADPPIETLLLVDNVNDTFTNVAVDLEKLNPGCAETTASLGSRFR